MQWKVEEYGGVSEKEPWIPMSAAYRKEITVEAQQHDKNSVLSFYKQLIAMRKRYPVIARGEISFPETETDMVFAYQRTLGEQEIVVLCNLDKKEQAVRTADEWRGYQVLLKNYDERKINPEEEVYTLKPYELMVLGNV